MRRGEVIQIQHRSGEWMRVLVVTALGEGLGSVLLVVRRLSDRQRLILFRDGDLVEVAG